MAKDAKKPQPAHTTPGGRFVSAVNHTFWFLATEMVVLTMAMLCWNLLYSMFEGVGKNYPQVKEKWFFTASMWLSQVVLFLGVLAHAIIQVVHSWKEVVTAIWPEASTPPSGGEQPNQGRK